MIGNICPAENGGIRRGPNVTQRERRDAPTLSFWTASETPRVIPVAQLHRDFDRLFFFKSSLHLVHTRGPISSSMGYTLSFYTCYMEGEGDIYIYKRIWENVSGTLNFQKFLRLFESGNHGSRDHETRSLKLHF